MTKAFTFICIVVFTMITIFTPLDANPIDLDFSIHKANNLKTTSLFDEVFMCTDMSSVDTEGVFYDSGGALSNYQNNQSCTFLIDPGCALSITMVFSSFETESCCDFFSIYDGVDANAPLIGTYGGSNSPGTVIANSGKLFFVFTTDSSVTRSGWEANWTSTVSNNAPVADFSISNNNSPVNTSVQFTDLSTEFPANWLWDFGDGLTSSEQNPEYTYSTPGNYSVTLIVENCFDFDTVSYPITIQDLPIVSVNPSSVDVALACGDSTTVDIILGNSGLGDLVFEALLGGEEIMDSSLIVFNEFNNFTNHLFDGISPIADSIFLDVTLNGDFGTSTETADLFIDGNFIATLTGGSSNGVDYTTSFVFTSPQIDSWLADGMLEINLINSINVNDDQGGDNSHRVNLSTNGSSWSAISPNSGILNLGGSQILSLNLNSLGLNSGIYNNDLLISTNDPTNPVVTIPITLEVTGEANISFTTSCLTFPDILQFTSDTMDLVIMNSGCDTLMISNIFADDAAYQVNNTQLEILPFHSDTIMVYFNPLTVGSFNSNLNFISNIAATSLCLEGVGLGAPVASVNPDEINVTLACGDSTSVDIVLTNTGLSNLNFTAVLGGQSVSETSVMTFNDFNSFTDHVFTGLSPGLDSIYVDVTVNGDFDDTGEFVNISIDGFFIGTANGGNFNGTDYTTTFAFGEAEIAGWLSDGILNFQLFNSLNVDDDQGGTNTHTVTIRTRGNSWESVSPQDGQVAVGGNQTLTVGLNSAGLAAGNYMSTMLINSNDPTNPSISVPVNLEVIGDANIGFTIACLDFPPTMQYTTTTLALAIENSGCASLSITDIFADDPAYTVDITELTIPAFSLDTILVHFTSTTIGNFPSMLNFVSNAGSSSLCLSGTVFGAPSVAANPGSIDISLTSCNDVVTVPVTISNNAFDSLYYSFQGNSQNSSDLDAVLENLNADFEGLTAVIPNPFLFTDGEVGTNINDGGSDLYDGGNYLSVDFGASLIYSNDFITTTTGSPVIDQYFTRKYPGLFIFAADIDDATTFTINGNLGQDGGGLANVTEVLSNHLGTNYRGFVKRAYDTTTPSVTHLIIVEDQAGLSQLFTTNTNDDFHQVDGLNQNDRIYYLLFAESSGAEYTDAQMLEIMETFLNIVESNGFAEVPEGDYELAAGESQVFDIVFSTNNTEGGVYNTIVNINSNDPLNPILEIPVTINVSFDLCAEFNFAQPIACGGQVDFTSSVVNDTDSYLWDFGDGNTSTEANPSHLYTQAGTYTVTLDVSNNTSTDQVSYTVTIDQTSAPLSACDPSSQFDPFPFILVSNVILNTISNQSGFNTPSDYSDFTCEWNTTLILDVPYELQIEGNQYGISESVRVWIDLNNSGTFEFNEIVYEDLNQPPPHIGSITIPQNATLGVPLRMRIANVNDYANPPSPCVPLGNGEIEDYTVFLESNMAAPVANLSQFFIDQCEGLIQFNDESANLPTAWLWDFGDGNTSSIQNPIHSYETAGVYIVTLTASNDFGSDILNSSITVNALNPFIETVGALQINTSISFLPNAPGSLSWSWTFGDGNTSTSEFPNHIYTTPGIYLVTLTATNNIGCSVTVIGQIDVLLTGIAELKEHISIYPNPSSGQVFIENTGAKRYEQVEIINALGQVMKRIPTNGFGGDRFELNLADLSSGVYVVALRFEGEGVLREKIVLEISGN